MQPGDIVVLTRFSNRSIRPGSLVRRGIVAGGVAALLLAALLLVWWSARPGAPEPEPAPGPPVAYAGVPVGPVDPEPDRAEALIQPVALPGDDYRFQDALGPLPFTYEPPLPAPGFAELLAPYTAHGAYVTDRRTEPRPADPGPADPGYADPAPSLDHLYWKRFKTHTLEELPAIVMTALRDEFRPALSPIGARDGKSAGKTFNRVYAIATSVDPHTALALAQMQLRLAPSEPEPLFRAFERYLASAWLAGEHALVGELLESGPAWGDSGTTDHWRPQLTELFAATGEDPPALALRLAVARGDVGAARTILSRLPQASRPRAADAWLARLEGELGAGLDEEARAAFRTRLAAIVPRPQTSEPRPLCGRFAHEKTRNPL